jgi:hypothetical protein
MPFTIVVEFARRQAADSAPSQSGREMPAVARISSNVLCPKSGLHNNSQELTWLAGKECEGARPAEMRENGWSEAGAARQLSSAPFGSRVVVA